MVATVDKMTLHSFCDRHSLIMITMIIIIICIMIILARLATTLNRLL